MKIHKLSVVHVIIFAAAVIALIPIFSPESATVRAQGGNSITGYVFGLSRQPLEYIEVELLDDFGRLVKRVRTSGSGYYSFDRISSGNFRVRVKPLGSDYEEQERAIEIVNFGRSTISGGSVTGGFSNEQVDFFLKLRKGATEKTGAVFVQQVPEEAKKLYEKAVQDLDNKKEKEGLQGLLQAIEKFPDYFMALERLGTEYVQKGASAKKYYEASQILLSKAVTVNPRGFRSWYGLAYSLYSLDKYDEASTAVAKALEIYPNWADALLLNGVLLRQAKKFDEAEKQFLKAKEFSAGTTPMVHWHLALLYGNDLKRYRDAAKELRLFLKAQPDSKNAQQIEKLIADFEAKAEQK